MNGTVIVQTLLRLTGVCLNYLCCDKTLLPRVYLGITASEGQSSWWQEQLCAHIMIHKKEEVSKRYTEWHQYFDNSELSPSDIPPSTRTHLLTHPKWLHQLYTEKSNLRDFGGHSYPDHHRTYYLWQGDAFAYGFHLKVMSFHICHHSMPVGSAVGKLVGCAFMGDFITDPQLTITTGERGDRSASYVSQPKFRFKPWP